MLDNYEPCLGRNVRKITGKVLASEGLEECISSGSSVISITDFKEQ